MQQEQILILDFGGQYSQLIARRVREAKVYSTILPYDVDIAKIKELNPEGIIFSGGPKSVTLEDAPKIDKEIFELGIPILGICYGMQLMAKLLAGGVVEKAEYGEYGKARLNIIDNQGIYEDIEDSQVWMSHGDHVKEVPDGFVIAARTEVTPVAAMSNYEKGLYGVQFHPEVVHTIYGKEILHNFLFRVCGVSGDWNMADFINEELRTIKAKVGSDRVISGLSGGVDSAVASAMVHKAIGDQLTCIFVDHGLLRKGEAEQVKRTFAEEFNMSLVYVDARERFLKKLAGVKEPEEKRKIIGSEFIRVFEEEAAKLGDARYLVQGTLYSDVIESGGSDSAATIKSHHNVGGLPEDIEFELIEPLRDLFKDEVRKIGEVLGLPDDIVWRQPFPGPGLAIRIIGTVEEEKLEILREADAIIQEEIKEAGLYKEIWQSFAVLPEIRSVGVMGDERTYGYPIVFRAVTSDDAMTADWARLPYELMERIANRIVNEVKSINRVVYDITSKPPGTIEWE
ncbi:glutamine-hydrolyzing GMP synthase [Iocasia frigidifontis]|uniref:GMP synthase [glutamine-hydrolyzing] n=1 Tax=Iocasia fonsfrigidae TaxID=2682810 RepID=A0A8A7KD64_9FIRM|nr:glutamine-hydrolyzing GMP synthase [Iocasia fonsfrigidae]QTL99200.1 glutamine-hydrolyzing GMP synthase [Iocasia fonsfrigidae]